MIPSVAGGAALNVAAGGVLNGGNLSVAVSGNGITTGCINFFNTALDACDLSGGNTFGVIAPSDANLFTFNSTAHIKDIPAPNVLPETAFLAVPGPSTVYFDLTSVVLPNQVPCAPGSIAETCSIGNFVFSQTCDQANVCTVLVAFSVKADAYTGTHATGFTPYAITFTSQFVNTNIGNLITTIANGGAIQDSLSFSASPVPVFTGCTVTQGGWGSAPHGNNPGAFLAAHFPAGGITVGLGYPNPSGPPFWLHFSAAMNIQNFLPQGGPPGALNASALNPTLGTSAGVFAGQVLALQLNSQLENLGLLTLSGTGTSLDGSTVAQVLAAANTALAGGPLPAGFSYSSLNDLIDSLNSSFDGCVASSFGQGHLQ